MRELSRGIINDKLFQKSCGLSFLFVLLMFPLLFLLLSAAGFYVNMTDAVAKVNRYLYEIIPVDPEYKEAILNNVFIFSEQITANYVKIGLSGILTLIVILYYISSYLKESISSFIEYENYSNGIFYTAVNFIVCCVLFAISFVLTTLLFDPFAFIKETFVLNLGAKVLILSLSLVIGYFLFKRILTFVFIKERSKIDMQYSIYISLILFEILKNFYLYYVFFISRPLRITGNIELVFISLIILFYFSFMVYLSIEIKLVFKKIKYF